MDITQKAAAILANIKAMADSKARKYMADAYADPDFMGFDDRDIEMEAEYRYEAIEQAKWDLVKKTLFRVASNMSPSDDRSDLLIIVEIAGSKHGD